MAVVTVKLTDAELDLLDWLVARLDAGSRSDALRRALTGAASREGIRTTALLDVADERAAHRPRRSLRNIRREHRLAETLGPAPAE
jgi:Arc/MetJ-type ribon-helix-helix transcriptional regulator